jgi:hypothetical protein
MYGENGKNVSGFVRILHHLSRNRINKLRCNKMWVARRLEIVYSLHMPIGPVNSLLLR